MMLRIFISFSFVVFLQVQIMAKIGEVPLTILPSGQILIPVNFSDNSGTHLVLLEVHGENAFRTDLPKKLSQVPMDTTRVRQSFDEFKIGDYTFKNQVSFKRDKQLASNANKALPPNCIGTLGFSTFRSKAIQINLKDKKLVVADAFDEMIFSEDVKIVVLGSSYVNNVPVVNVKTSVYGTQKMFIDPSKPFGFHYSRSELPENIRELEMQELKTRTIRVFGKDSISMIMDKPMPIFMEEETKVEGFPPLFSDNFPPCIGAEFLRNYSVIIDFSNGILCLDPLNEKAKKETTELE